MNARQRRARQRAKVAERSAFLEDRRKGRWEPPEPLPVPSKAQREAAVQRRIAVARRVAGYRSRQPI